MHRFFQINYTQAKHLWHLMWYLKIHSLFAIPVAIFASLILGAVVIREHGLINSEFFLHMGVLTIFAAALSLILHLFVYALNTTSKRQRNTLVLGSSE